MFLTQGLALEGVRRKLKEFHDSIGEEGGEEDAERQRAKVMRLLLELGYEEVAEPEEAPQLIAETNGIPDAGTGMPVMLCSTCWAYSMAQLLQVSSGCSLASQCCGHKARAVESTALQIVHPAHRPVSPAVEDPFQLEGLEERAPPLPEDEAPVASTAAADDAEPRNGASKSSQDAHQAEVGWLPPDGAYASHAAQIAICVLEAVHCTGHALILPTLALQ